MAKDFTVAIIGGGLCGLAAAYPLLKAGVSVKVFEAAPKFEEVGAGVALGPNAIRALESLGLLNAILAHSDQHEPVQRLFKFVEGPAPHKLVFDYETTNQNNLGLGIYRPACLNALISLLDPSIIHFNKRCTSITTGLGSDTSTRESTIHFADGTTYNADVVIGADGVRSVTRQFVTRKDQDSAAASKTGSLVFSNTYAYRGLVPLEDLVRAGMKTDLSVRPTCYVGKGKHIVCFPIKGGQVVNFVAFVAQHELSKGPELPLPWVQSVSHKELKEQYGDWGPEGQIIVEHLKDPSRWSLHACIPPLDSYVRGRVVLVGDAAHPMLPHLGAGVGQGFEDVFMLTELLTHPQIHKGNLDQILACYNDVRLPRANDVSMRSTEAAEKYDNYDPLAGAEAGGYDIPQMQARLRGQWEPVWDYDVQEVLKDSIRELQTSGIFSSVGL